MIIVRDLWQDRTWELPDDDAFWDFAQRHVPEALLEAPRTTPDLAHAIARLQNWDVALQGHPEVDVAVPAVARLMEAARIARERPAGDPRWRAAVVLHEGDLVAAALAAVQEPITPENRRAVQGLLALRPGAKAERPPGEVVAGTPDAASTAAAVRRAFEAGHVEEPDLGGRHSEGTLLIHDPESQKDILLKPGSGPASPAVGVSEEAASQTRREVASWHVLHAIGLGDLAPRCDLVRIGDREYAAEHWLGKGWEPAAEADQVRLVHEWHRPLSKGDLHILAAALWILGDADGHAHNFLVKDGQVRAIDFGSALAGDGFDPGHDPSSFVPFVLRVWAQGDFAHLPPEERLAKLPLLSGAANTAAEGWLRRLDRDAVGAVLARYGIQVGPTLRRLALLQATVAAGRRFDEAVDRAWTVGLR